MGSFAGRSFSAADHSHVRGHGDADGGGEAVDAVSADRKPASGVEQVTGIVPYVGQLEARNRAVVAGFELPFVFEGQRGGGIFAESLGQGHPDGMSCVTRSADSGLLLASRTRVTRMASWSSKTATFKSCRAVNLTLARAEIWWR